MGVGIIKWVRRIIILACIVLLAIGDFGIFPSSKYYDESVKKAVKENNAKVIEVDKSLKIDDDVIHIKRIIIDPDGWTYIRYSYISSRRDWSNTEFPWIEMYDNQGKRYRPYHMYSSYKIWGQDGVTYNISPSKDPSYVTIRIEHYDRYDEVKIPIRKDGEAND